MYIKILFRSPIDEIYHQQFMCLLWPTMAVRKEHAAKIQKYEITLYRQGWIFIYIFELYM